jgi:phosphoribosylformylglycinamidine synthase subunit PurS
VTRYQVDVRVVPRTGILDPQGKAVGDALASLGFEGIGGVHVGRVIELTLEADSDDDARGRAESMCRQLLANPVTEDFRIEVRQLADQEHGA